MCCKRLAPMRFTPFSYFWMTCWNDTPIASPSAVWLMSKMSRRMRTRLPTCFSTGRPDFDRGIPYPGQS